MSGYRALGFALGFTASITGSIYDIAAAATLTLADAGDHTVVAPVSGLSGTAGLSSGYVYVVSHLNATTGDEIFEPPRDARGHAASYLSPRREAKGKLQRNDPKLKGVHLS